MNSGVNFFSELCIDTINGESRITQIMKYCRAICFACMADDRLNWMKRQWHYCWIGPGPIFLLSVQHKRCIICLFEIPKQ